MSVFDSIMGDIVPFAEASLKGAGLGGGAKDTQSAADSSEYRSLRLMNMLSAREMSLPYRQGDEFTASKSKPAEQSDSESINQQWLQRLNRYASIPQVEGARAK